MIMIVAEEEGGSVDHDGFVIGSIGCFDVLGA